MASANPSGKYFDGSRGQMVHFDYLECRIDGKREAYLLIDGTWLSGVRKTPLANLLQRRTSKRAPRWVNPASSLSEVSYPSVFGDSDNDRIPDVDDPHPFSPGDVKSIEEVRLSDEISEFLEVRDAFVPATRDVMDRLEEIGIQKSKVTGRVKTPFSMINKLRRKRLGTLTDVAGTRIVVPDEASVEIVGGVVEDDFEVLDKDDYYEKPQAGYRALHYIVRSNGLPVEIQIKTRRMSKITEGSHTPYKRGKLNASEMDRLTDLAAQADAGDRSAASEIDPLLRDTAALQRRLTQKANPARGRKSNPDARMLRLARQLARGGRY